MTWPPCLRGSVPPALALLLATAAAGPASGQSVGEVRVEAGTATALPAAGVEDGAAVYGITGLSLDWAGDRVAAEASLHGGLALDAARGGDFATVRIRGEAWTGRPSGAALGLVGQVYGFTVRAPFTYRNGSLSGGPALRWNAPVARGELRVEGGTGAAVTERRRRTDGPSRRVEQHLWSVGSVVELERDVGPTTLAATGGTWRSAGGSFRSAGLAVTGGSSRLALRGEVGVWDTPSGREWVGGVALALALGGRWSLQALAGWAGPDPVTLVEAGAQSGATVAWAVKRFDSPAGARLWERVSGEGGGARVRFRVERDGARRVEITGDFTGWEPRPMEPDGTIWRTELEVPVGTHHFGFLVDGEWYVPEGQPGNVPDEWGRTNATLIVAPAG